jgi:uncharacterized protein
MVTAQQKPIESSILKLPKTRQHLWQKDYPKKHNHYSHEDFFHFQRDNGTIIDWNEERNVFVTEDFVIGLIEGLEEEVGSASAVVMYEIGREWGKYDIESFRRWFTKEYGKEIAQFPLAFALEAWWWPFTSQGWGNWDLDLSEQKNGFMFINIFDSAIARTLGDVGKPVCHIYAGLFSGFFTGLVGKDLGCIEIQCYATGETYCKFVLGKQDRIDAASFWQNEGATAKDIQKRLHNGEYLG